VRPSEGSLAISNSVFLESQENVSPVLASMPPLLRMCIPQIKAKEVQTTLGSLARILWFV
jgi:hypothetical protein